MPIFLLLNSIAACGQVKEKHNADVYVEPEFQYYVELFEAEQETTVEIEMKFNTIEYPAVGRCYYAFYIEGPKKGERINLNIEIDPIYWNEASDTEKEVLLFHEMGHCVLNKEHNETVLTDFNMPKSIMYPYVFNNPYSRYRDYYVNELKNENTLLTDYLN